MEIICLKENCTGCGACESICKHMAIDMLEDECGFRFPVINQNVCIDCGLCKGCCPSNSNPELRSPLSAIIGYAKNIEEQKTSSSGGLASVFGRYILDRGGLVYGASGANAHSISHVRIDNINKLTAIKGSKYVQSNIGDVFKQVELDLLNDRIVLFIGTPCQVSGLKSFLRKTYHNLYTVDFVCHGVPSQKIFNDALGDLGISREKNCKVDFRCKTSRGKTCYGLFIKGTNGERIVYEKFPSNLYIVGFLQGLYYRESCYNCRFAHKERISDITLGDYLDKYKKDNLPEGRRFGLSMIMINTKKGIDLWNGSNYMINYVNGTLSDFINRNRQLIRPMAKHKAYDSFRANYVIWGFSKAAKMALKDDIRSIKKHLLIIEIVNIICKIPLVKNILDKLRKK